MSEGPIEEPLVEGSTLASGLCPGIRAVKKRDRSAIAGSTHEGYRDSLDLDAALAADHPKAPRWDYRLGYRGLGIVGLEVHPA